MSVSAFASTDPWFIDNLDNTTVQLLSSGGVSSPTTGTICPDPRVRVRQSLFPNVCDFDLGPDIDINCEAEGGGIFTFGDFKLDFDPELPADFGFVSGSISRFDDRLSLFIEEFTPSRVGEPTSLVQAQAFDIVKTFITRYDFINRESLGTSDGSSNQIFQVSGSEIKTPTKGTPFVFVGGDSGTKFTQIDDLDNAEATDNVFEYDKTSGEVRFGNGTTNGAIPANGQEIVLKISIREGGGIWEFRQIVVAPKNFENVGGVKSIADKVFYVRAKIAGADASKWGTVNSTMDVIRQRLTFEGTVLRDTRIWSLGWGGSASASGGEAILRNTGGSTFSTPRTPRAGETPTSGISHAGNTVTVGTARDAATHKVLDITGAYPSISGSAPSGGKTLLTTINDDPNNQVVEMTPMSGGIITSPKQYEVGTTAYPIFQVIEVQNFFFLDVTTQCEITLIPNPSYSFFFFIWPDIDFFPGLDIEDFSPTRIIDSANNNQFRAAFRPFSGTRGVFSLIEIADITSDFDNSIHEFGAQESQWTDLDEGTTKTAVGAGAFSRLVVGSSDRHPEWATMKYEFRDTDANKAIETHQFGSPHGDFTCTWTGIEGGTTLFADRDIVRGPGGNPALCIDPIAQAFDARISLVQGYSHNIGFYPLRFPSI